MIHKQRKIQLLVCLCAGTVISVVLFLAVLKFYSYTFVEAAAVITSPTTGSSVAGESAISGTRTTDAPVQLFLDGSTKPFYRTSAPGNSFTTKVPPTTCGSHTISAQEYTNSTYGTTSGSASSITVTVTSPCGGSVQLGNFIWKDDNNDGLNGETLAGINNVYLELYRDMNANNVYDEGTDVFVTGTTTASNGGFPGFYNIASLQDGNYFIRIHESNFATNGALLGMLSSTGSSNQYEPAPGPNNDVNNDDNGTQVGGTTGYVVSGVINLAAGTEPTTDGDSSTNTNYSVDFGFVAGIKLGDYIWNDANNNGVQDDGVSGINGVLVNLYKDTNANGTFDAGTDTLVTSDTSYSNGGFPGHYEFANLYPGDYIVQVDTSNFNGSGALVGKVSATGASTYTTGAYEPAPDPDNDASTDDNSTQVGGLTGYAVSQAITLTVGGEPTPGFGITNFNATLDFGFIGTLTVGNYIWNDANNNGLQDDGVSGINGVLVNLYKDTNANGTFDAGTDTLVTSVTSYSNGGFPGAYQFNGLYPGDYIVQIPNSNFTSGFALSGRVSSTGTANAYEPAADPDNNIDNDDNGSLASNPNNGVVSQAITLTVGGEPTPGFGITNFNATLDFGFYTPLVPTPDLLMSVGYIGRFQQGKRGIVGYTVADSYNAVPVSNTITMSSTLPSGLSFSSDNVVGTNWNCSKTATTINCTYTGTYPVKTDEVLPVVYAFVDVALNAPSSVTLVGSTTVPGESSGLLANNSSAKAISVDTASYVSPYNASLITAIPTRDDAFNSLLTQNGPGWTGSDVAFSQRLPDGRTAWTFGDSYIGTSDPATRQRSNTTQFIRNSMMVQTGMTMSTIINGTVNSPETLFQNGDPSKWYWPADLFMEGGKLHVFLHEFTSNGSPGDFNFVKTGHNDIATLDPNTFAIESITPTISSGTVSWGLTVNEEDATYVYIYGNEDVSGTRYTHVARAPKGSVMDTSSWQFYDGTSWSSLDDESPATRVVDTAASSVIKVNDGYMLVGNSAFSRTIDGYFSKTPWGPWGDKTVLYNMPELQTGNRRYAYNPVVHTEATDDRGILLSYDANILGGDTNSDSYRPWFVRIQFNTLGVSTSTGSSVATSTSGGESATASARASTAGSIVQTTEELVKNVVNSPTKTPSLITKHAEETYKAIPESKRWLLTGAIMAINVISIAGIILLLWRHHRKIGNTFAQAPKLFYPTHHPHPL